MSKVNVTVVVSKEIYEAGQGVAKFVKAMKVALADGWQAGSDLPVAMSHALSDLVPALNGITEVAAEVAEDKQAAAHAVSLSLCDVLFS